MAFHAAPANYPLLTFGGAPIGLYVVEGGNNVLCCGVTRVPSVFTFRLVGEDRSQWYNLRGSRWKSEWA